MSLLAVRGISKRFGAVVALRSANLTVEPGEVHALLGANGAGKSTLVKVLTGVTRPDAGTIALNGVAVRVSAPADAQRVGLAAVFQDPALVPDLTVRQNLVLTGIDVGVVRQWLGTMDLPGVDLDDLIGDLPLPMLRLLDLARALARAPQLLMLDEMTAALPADLAGRVFEVIRRWRAQGRSILFISHRLVEVGAICDRATVLRDGSDVGTLSLGHGSEGRIVDLMLGPAGAGAASAVDGRAAARGPAAPPEAAQGGMGALARTGARTETAKPLLEVKGLSAGAALSEVSFTVRAGEILGVVALEAQGQDILFDCLAGHRRGTGGEIRIAGRRLAARTPYDAIRAGMVLVPADRLHALLPQRSVRENIALPLYNSPRRWGLLQMRQEQRRVAGAIAQLAIDTRAQRQVRQLSGGNQQKVTVARWLAAGFRVLLCFDPTRGIDLGTKRQLHALLRELAAGGAAILLFTSELPEVPLVCDRVVVLYEGRVVHEMPAAAAHESTLLHAAHGLTSPETV
jgi:ribose transport system ATP-binding protein